MVRKAGPAIARFGPYEFDSAAGQLRKHGLRVKLQGHPVQLLAALLEQPGDVVTRDEIQRRLWPADTFVDFENGLNTAVKRLRTALHDAADRPVYVETVARTGYRFIAPVTNDEPALDPAPTRRDWLRPAALGSAAACLGAAGTLLVQASRPKPSPAAFLPVTFQRGAIYGARFAPDGRSILYAAQFSGGPRRVYLHNGVSPESRALELMDYSLLGVSASGELALSRFGGNMPTRGGTLERVMMNAGAPRVAEEDVMSADWSPDGGALALVRARAGANQLEYPAGRVLHRSSGWLSSVRVSPDGQWIAFIDHPVRHDDAGVVRIIGAQGGAGGTSRRWANAGGLAWRRAGELWLTATTGAGAKSVWSVGLDGREKPLLAAPGALTVTDVSRVTGRALVQREARRLEMAGSLKGAPQRDLSWLDWSRVCDLSADGRQILFEESGDAVAQRPVTYLRSADNTIRLGEGVGQALSPDGRFALMIHAQDRRRLLMVPVEGGDAREHSAQGLELQWARFYPDGQSAFALASEPGKPLRIYRIALDGSRPPQPLTPAGMVRHAALSRDGQRLAVLDADGKLVIYPADEPGAARVVSTDEPLGPIAWKQNHRHLFAQHLRVFTEVPSRVSVVDTETGALEPWRSVGPADTMGVNSVTRVMISADERSWVISYRRLLSELYQLAL